MPLVSVHGGRVRWLEWNSQTVEYYDGMNCDCGGGHALLVSHFHVSRLFSSAARPAFDLSTLAFPVLTPIDDCGIQAFMEIQTLVLAS